MYHEKQVGRQCTLHALNNALQGQPHRVTFSDMNAIVEGMIDHRMNRQRASARASRQVHRAFLMHCQDGFFAPDVAYVFLNKIGYSTKIRQSLPQSREAAKNRRFIVTGQKAAADNKSSYGHSIAVYDGYVIDSERKKVIALPATAYFKRFQIGEVREIIETSKVSNSKKSSASVIVID